MKCSLLEEEETSILKVSRTFSLVASLALGKAFGGFEGAANLAPQIHLIAGLQRERKSVRRKSDSLAGVSRQRSVAGSAGAACRRSGLDGGKKGGAGGERGGAGLDHPLGRDFQSLIGGHRLGFQIVELPIAEDFPPIALGNVVARRGVFPAFGRLLFPCGRSVDHGSMVIGPHHAARRRNNRDTESS